MLWTGYLAVAAWLVSLEQWALVPIWIGSILGLESGRRFGLSDGDDRALWRRLGFAFLFGISLRLVPSTLATTIAPIPVIALSVVAWITVFAIAWWLFIGIRKKSLANKQQRAEPQSMHQIFRGRHDCCSGTSQDRFHDLRALDFFWPSFQLSNRWKAGSKLVR